VSKFEEFFRTSSAGHLAVGLIRGDCVYLKADRREFARRAREENLIDLVLNNYYEQSGKVKKYLP
jgi:hypothetical protein